MHTLLGAQHNWGPTHSYSSEDSSMPRRYKKTGVFGGNMFKVSVKSPMSCATTPSKGSSQSNKTALTSPITASSATGPTGERHYVSPQLAMKTGILHGPSNSPKGPFSPGDSSNNMTSVATAGSTSVVANFWKYSASPANRSRVGEVGGLIMEGADGTTSVPSSAASLLPPGPQPATTTMQSSPLSTSAKAAADAVIEMISKAEIFLETNTGISLALSGGLCSQCSFSPTNGGDSSICDTAKGISKEIVMEQGDKNERKTETKTNICGQNANFFEFEEFGFNPFQDSCFDDNNKRHGGGCAVKNEKNISLSPSIIMTQQRSPSTSHLQKPARYEIRLKSTLSKMRVKKESLIDQTRQVEKGGLLTTLPEIERMTEQNNPEHDYIAPLQGGSRALPGGLPFKEAIITTEIQPSVSELTMRSHSAYEMHQYTSDSRRMAYYAVGRAAAKGNDDGGYGNGNNNKSGGNRRCYFTGCAILDGMPFFAGSVQQGPRTLVVFCLPSALDLATFDDHHLASRAERERYLETLPQPDANLLSQMSRRYPEPFETLPVQVRSPHCWRLFVKFCFFSGLPIAEGEMHYRVKSSVVTFTASEQGEEVALSHDVMEAVNGEDSADLLRLPNRKVFDYLKRQYSHQCSKLNEEVFDRKSWEAVMPEV
ncbi:hypothetical protein ACHAW5_001687 [Stephanodiscus triporus]|uniref:Uncharacterized protein n=1 Tax=Stephanodiscus triporus TaxID=2934178 RepID=A0ABD3Q8V7_9STRA